MAESVHRAAREGYTSTTGTNYDRSRPGYTDELVSHVVQNLYTGHSEGIRYNILELGAGTGKFTREILKKIDKDVRFLATEPSEGFLSVLREQSPDTETSVCAASSIPLPDRSVQNVVCAQCFHWFADQESLKEICRVLVPNGRLFCVWNAKVRDQDIWMIEMEEILTVYYTEDLPIFHRHDWKSVFEDFPGLDTVSEETLAGITDMKGDKNYILDHYCSISVISMLSEEDRVKARASFKAVLDKHFSDNHVIQMPFTSYYFCTEAKH